MSSRLAKIVAGFKTGFWSHRSSGFVGEKRCSSVNIKVLFSFNNVCVEKKIVSALRELFIMLLENVFVAASLLKVLKKFGRKKIRLETTFLKK